ncbi:MAG: extracellular matrix regulator RemB [Dethiobacteria bacterium]|jgi:hypothetical protein
MFLHIGNFRVLPLKDIIGIFNMDLRDNQINKQFLESFSGGKSEEDPKNNNAFIITSTRVYYSPVLPLTLQKRVLNNSVGKYSGGIIDE